MAVQYYLLRGKSKLGPYTLETLSQQNITDSDMIWYEGLTEWKFVYEDEIAKKLIIPKPIPIPPTPHEVSSSFRVKVFGHVFKEFLIEFLIIGVIIFIVIGGFSSNEVLKNLYLDEGEKPIYATENELRYQVLTVISFILFSFPISAVISIFRFRYLLKK